MSPITERLLSAVPLTEAAWAPFGSYLGARATPPRRGNQGRAEIWDRAGDLVQTRPGARPNLSVFRTGPWVGDVEVVRLERHLHSTQMFIPMSAARYLLIVAPPGPAPDLAAAAAFIAPGNVGITYFPGTWHHPLIALDRSSDFTALVWEDGTGDDCELVPVSGLKVLVR